MLINNSNVYPFKIRYLLFRMLISLRYVWMVVPPLCILVGTVGNALTLLTVTSKRGKKISFVIYLGALAVADTASLYFIAFNAWLFYAFGIDIMLSVTSCKIFGFMLHVCRMWSSLLVATLSTDRMVCSCFPLKRELLGSGKSALIIISITFGFVFIINVHELYGFKLITIANVSFCGYVDEDYAYFLGVYFAWIDTSVYFILPSIVIIVTNIMTVKAAIKSTKQASHLMNVESVRNRNRNNRQMIVMAVTVSLTFFFLTLPGGIYFIIRPYLFSDPDLFDAANHAIGYLCTTIAFNLAYVNFAINFFLYVISGRQFREDFKAAFPWGRRFRVAT